MYAREPNGTTHPDSPTYSPLSTCQSHPIVVVSLKSIYEAKPSNVVDLTSLTSLRTTAVEKVRLAGGSARCSKIYVVVLASIPASLS